MLFCSRWPSLFPLSLSIYKCWSSIFLPCKNHICHQRVSTNVTVHWKQAFFQSCRMDTWWTLDSQHSGCWCTCSLYQTILQLQSLQMSFSLQYPEKDTAKPTHLWFLLCYHSGVSRYISQMMPHISCSTVHPGQWDHHHPAWEEAFHPEVE